MSKGICDWRDRKKCRIKSTILYSVETKSPKEMCQEHFTEFCEMQDKGEEDVARQRIGLKPRKKYKYTANEDIDEEAEVETVD